MSTKRKSTKRCARCQPKVAIVPVGMGQGGFNPMAIISRLQTANQIARQIKPATHLGRFMDATGLSSGRVGRHVREAARVGQSLGYGGRRRFHA